MHIDIFSGYVQHNCITNTRCCKVKHTVLLIICYIISVFLLQNVISHWYSRYTSWWWLPRFEL